MRRSAYDRFNSNEDVELAKHEKLSEKMLRAIWLLFVSTLEATEYGGWTSVDDPDARVHPRTLGALVRLEIVLGSPQIRGGHGSDAVVLLGKGSMIGEVIEEWQADTGLDAWDILVEGRVSGWNTKETMKGLVSDINERIVSSL